MRLGVVWVPCGNAYYRAIDPLHAMGRRGHEIVAPPDGGAADPVRLAACDVVHVYRRCDARTHRTLSELVRAGTPITYDNDDDFTSLPKEAPEYKRLGGLEGQRGFARSVRMARLAHTFTTTTQVLADKYRRAGAERVEVIANYLAPETPRPRPSHDGVVIGWIAGGEHRADVARIPIVAALERVQAKHPDVRVECIGVNLGLRERYRHDASLHFRELPARIGGFDIGIAPLADIPINRARSDIKVKEYAGSGVPWLASPIGPYVGLGEEQGGRLVADDGWFEALDRLVADAAERDALGAKGRAWAQQNTIEAVADRWEDVFAGAARPRAGRGGPARPSPLGPGVKIRLPGRGGR